MSSVWPSTRFKWDIGGLVPKISEGRPESAIFSDAFSLIKSDVKLNLKLVANAYSSNTENYYSLYLQALDLNGRKSLKVNYTLSIEDVNGNECAHKPEATYVFDKLNRFAGYKKMAESGRLFNSTRSHWWKAKQFVYCKIQSKELADSLNCQDVCEIHYFPKYIHTTFLQKIWRFYQSGVDDNCTLKHGKREFKVSKSLLTAQSEFFQQIFLLDGNIKNKFEFENLSLEVVEALVEYTYLQEIDKFGDIIEKLFIAASIYKFHILKMKCVEHMSKVINEENAVRFLVLAFTHSDDNLKKQTLQYINKDPACFYLKPVFKSSELKELAVKNEKLHAIILDHIFDKTYPKSGFSNALQSITHFKWTIRDFAKKVQTDDTTLIVQSEKFALHMTQLQAYLKNSHSSVDIVVEGLVQNESLNIAYKIWVEDSDGRAFVFREEEKASLSKSSNSIKCLNFDFHNHLSLTKFAADGIIHIYCDIILDEYMAEEFKTWDPYRYIGKKMFEIYKSGVNDSCILQVEGRPFKMSKTILMAISPFFKRHFSENGPKNNLIEMESVSQVAIEAIIRYSLLNNKDDLKEHVDEIFQIAHKYEMGDIKSRCVELMQFTFNSSNAARRIIAAYKCNDSRLKKFGINYIKQKPKLKYIKPFFNSDDWKAFSIKYKTLSNDILNDIYVDSD